MFMFISSKMVLGSSTEHNKLIQMYDMSHAFFSRLKDTPERDLTCKMGDLNRHSGQKILSIHKNSLFFILIAVFLDGYCVQQLHMHKSNHQIGQLRNLRSPRKKCNNQRGRLLRPYSLEVMAAWMLRIAWVFD